MKSRKIGVLALQGAFAKHADALKSLEANPILVRRPSELEQCEALIIPGGESSTISRRIDFIGLRNVIINFSKSKPIFGTCAGLILMAKTCQDPLINCFGIFDIEVQRNGFGRQNESFTTSINLGISVKEKPFHAIFIRAPRIKKTEGPVKILASYNDEPILIQQGRHLGAVFHPELSDDLRLHRYFLTL
jgi:5'-phosphate synthase pdxT subunit